MRQFCLKIWRFALDALFPAYCLGCRTEGTFLCSECQKTITRQAVQVCPWCYWPNGTGAACSRCQRPDRYLDGLVVLSRFEESSLLQHAIHELKYDFIRELDQPLGNLLAEAFMWQLAPTFSLATPYCILCPVPLHPKRQRWRGFNQTKLLCDVVLSQAHETGHDNTKVLELLDRVHFLRPQMELVREQRLANMRDAFRLKAITAEHAGGRADGQAGEQNFLDAPVVLVDDIATTLSTLNNAAKTLKNAGFTRVYGLALARVF